MEKKAALVKTASEVASPKFLKKLSEILDVNGSGFLVGKSVTFVDLSVVVFLNGLEFYYKLNLLADYPSVQGLVDRVEAIPEIKKWNTQHGK